MVQRLQPHRSPSEEGSGSVHHRKTSMPSLTDHLSRQGRARVRRFARSYSSTLRNRDMKSFGFPAQMDEVTQTEPTDNN